MQRFNVSSGPVVADYVTADREEELLRVLNAIGARDVLVGPEGNRVEITFVLDPSPDPVADLYDEASHRASLRHFANRLRQPRFGLSSSSLLC